MTNVISVNQAGGCDALDQTYEAHNWMYVGRGNRKYGGRWLARSPLANPFVVVNGKRGSAVDKFRVYLWEKIRAGDREIIEALVKVNEMEVLVCHCEQPGPCHAHEIIKASRWLMSASGEKYRVVLNQ